MKSNTLLLIAIGVVAGFAGGFMLANKLNGTEIAALRSQIGQSSKPADTSQTVQTNRSDETLSPDEIKAKVAEADNNPTDFAFQKDLGIGLYRYAAMKQDVALLADATRILERAVSIRQNDFDVLVALGNAEFDVAYFKKDVAGFAKARRVYADALKIKPDADVQTDIGISYFVQEPADDAKAAAELEKVTLANPQHSRSLQFLVQAYARLNRTADARRALDKLQAVEPNNKVIPELRTLLQGS